MDHPYVRLGVSLGISLVLMFVLSMSMVDTLDHFHLNLSNLYRALVMVAPMGVVMLLVMWGMYEDRRRNLALLAGFAVVFVGALVMGRSSTFVGDDQFLRAMIPHHSRAILVCEEAAITDAEIIELCGQIIQAQEEEIAQMERIIERLDGS